MGPKNTHTPPIFSVADCRARLALEPEEFATLVGSTSQELAAWESGRSPIPHRIAMLIELITAAPHRETTSTDRAMLRQEATPATSGPRRSTDAAGADDSELLAAVLDAIPVMARWYDAGGNVRLVNREASARLGWSAEEERSIDIIDVCFPDPGERARVRAFIADPDGSWMDQRITVRDGSQLHTSWTNVRLSDGSQIGLGIDISERVEREEALRTSRTWLEKIIDSSQDLIAAIDADYRLTACNRAYVAEFNHLFGRLVQVGDDFGDALAHLPCERASAMTLWSHALAGEQFRIEQTLGDSSRQRKVFDLTYSPIRNDAGRVIGAVQILRDNTELVEARKALEASERAARQQLRELETLYQTAPIGLGLFDRQVRCLRINETLAEINGHSVEEHLGRVIWDLLPDLRTDAEPRFEHVFATGEPLSFELHGTTPMQPGVERDWLELFYPLKGSDGTVEAVGVICREITEGKRSDAALRDSEARFRGTFENAAVGIGHLALDRRWLRVNQKLCDIVGYSREDLLSRSFPDITHPDDLPPNLERHDALVRGEISEYDIDKRYIRKDGTFVWVRVNVSLQRDEERRPAYAITIVQDISARKDIEIRLRDGEEKFRTLVECAPDGVLMHAADGRFYDVNQRGCDMLGYDRAELLTLSVGDIESAYDAGQLREIFSSMTPGQAGMFIGRNRRKDGTVFPVEVHVGCYARRGEKLFVGLVRDITERKRMEDALRESEERFHLFLDNSPAYAWMKDEDGALVYANRMSLDMYPVSDVVGRKDSELFPAETAQRFRESDLEVLRTDRVITFTEVCQTVQGRELVLSTLKFPLCDASGKRYVGGFALDITERKQIEEALRETEERFHLFVDNFPAWAWIKDEDGRNVYVNKAYQGVLGIPMADFIGRKDADFWPPETAEMFRRGDVEALTRNEAVRFVETCRTADAREIVLSTQKFPFTDTSGRRFVAGFAVDITGLAEMEKIRDSEELFRRMFDQSPVGAAMVSLEYRYIRVNAQFARMTGYTESELVTLGFPAISHPDDIQQNLIYADELLRGDIETYEIEKRFVRKNGSILWCNLNVRLIRNAQGEPLYYIPIMTDISARKDFEEALFREKDRAQVTLHSIGDGVITTDARGHIDYMNPVAVTMAVWAPEDARGRPLSVVFNTVDELGRQPLPDLVAGCLAKGSSINIPPQTLLLDRYGRDYAIEGSLSPLRSRNGDILGTVVVFRDVTQQRVLERKLEYDASHDPLTGLVNRRAFEDRLARAVMSARDKRYEHAVCFIDLDQFKVVNDSAGHAAGDALLKYVPTLLAGKIRERDTLARLGGDEFAVLLEHCPLHDAARIAQRIVAAFEDWRFAWDDRPYQVGASVGVVAVTEDAVDHDEILAKADVACYAAKEAGRNRIHVYRTEGASSSSHHAQIRVAARLKEALEQHRFRLYCQPIVSLANAADPARFEILVRLLDDDEGLVLPARFIPAAERYGLMPAIDRWVVRNTFLHYVHRPSTQAPVEITINLSGVALGREDFHEFVLGQFAETGMRPERVCFEITETAAIQNFDQALHFAQQIRSIGGRIALDDFGSGLSSFKYLRFLPTDYLKIDGAFVQSMLDNRKDFAMVAAINGIGHELGLATVAEWVDKPAIVDALRELGVDYAQGYALGVPMPLEDAFAQSAIER